MSLTVNFGRYRGQPASVLLSDREYVKWLVESKVLVGEKERYLRYLEENGDDEIFEILGRASPSQSFHEYVEKEKDLHSLPYYTQIEEWLKDRGRIVTASEGRFGILLEGVYIGTNAATLEEAISQMWGYLLCYHINNTERIEVVVI